MADKKTDTGSGRNTAKNKVLIVAVIIVILILFCLFVMIRNSIKPDVIDLSNVTENKKGVYFVKANQALVERMFDRWLPNDIFWPTIFLDNMPSFQLGKLEVVRYNTRVLRDNLTRMRTTDKLDPHAEKAFTSFSNDPYKWMFPSAESKWKEGYNSLELYYENLVSGASTFYPRADNLVQLLDQYLSLMGGVNTKLVSAARETRKVAPKDKENNMDLYEDKSDLMIPWSEIDDNFYYAQGVAYSLHLSFEAIKRDFYSVLQDKNSLIMVDRIIEDLGRCNFEPLFIFNGDPDSIFANHSLNLSGIFNDARQKISSLTVALKQG
ncbi:MAG: DUF2333 family protein [Deltaproteobacteria bacterium]|nr:DUF2333 family protein [Deltaproteobacteria bacterium]